MSQSAATIGLEMSAQGLEQRFSKEAAQFLQAVLEKVVEEIIIEENPTDIPLLKRFAGVYIRDSSVVKLPNELREIWRGTGGSKGENAAIKLQVDLNYSTGEINGPLLQNGRSQDQSSPHQEIQLPQGALHLADLGYFSLDRLERDNQNGVYWLSRLKSNTVIYLGSENCIDLLSWLQSQTKKEIDLPIYLGAKHKIPCRLLVQRVPQEIAQQRHRRLREEAQKKRQALSEKRLAMCDWTIVVSNVPKEKLSLKEALILLRIRWQIELLFKLWKSHAKIDEWRSKKPWRILCELYAKLIGVVISQWIFAISLWQFPERSLFRAAKTIQKFSIAFAISFQDHISLVQVLTRLDFCLKSRCRQETRSQHLAAFQLLLASAETV